MSESKMQPKNPYPQGVGVGSVPVLFSLKNVQPKIVGGIANSSTKTSNAIQTTKPGSATSTISPTAGLPPASLKPAPPNIENNRPYNIVVGLLILALCLLVIRNSQEAKSSSKNEIASSSTLINPTESKPDANSKVESTLPVERQLLVQAKPSSFPPLLPSSMPETQSESKPTTGSVNFSKAPPQSEVSFPKAVLPEIVETNAPPPSTRDLIHLHELGKQFSSQSTTLSGPFPRGTAAQGVQANTVSNVAPAVVGHSPSSPVMSGLPYPPLTKEYPPLTIPANEQNPSESPQSVLGSMQDSLPIRQPSNRYQYTPQSSTTPIPYTPIAPFQNGNSVGYPPGN